MKMYAGPSHKHIMVFHSLTEKVHMQGRRNAERESVETAIETIYINEIDKGAKVMWKETRNDRRIVEMEYPR